MIAARLFPLAKLPALLAMLAVTMLALRLAGFCGMDMAMAAAPVPAQAIAGDCHGAPPAQPERPTKMMTQQCVAACAALPGDLPLAAAGDLLSADAPVPTVPGGMRGDTIPPAIPPPRLA